MIFVWSEVFFGVLSGRGCFLFGFGRVKGWIRFVVIGFFVWLGGFLFLSRIFIRRYLFRAKFSFLGYHYGLWWFGGGWVTVHSLTSTLTLRLTLTNEWYRTMYSDVETRWQIDLMCCCRCSCRCRCCCCCCCYHDFSSFIIGRWWKGYPYCLNHTRMQRLGSK